MAAVTDNAQTTATSARNKLVKPLDMGFKWYSSSHHPDFFMLTLLCRIDGTSPLATPLTPDTDQSLDITIELKGERPYAEMQLKVTADIEKQKYKIRKSNLKEKTLYRDSPDKM